MSGTPKQVHAFPEVNAHEPIRLVALDGGGIYGLASALLLKRICERDEAFLSRDQVWTFAGTSAGALNALLLASSHEPREQLLSGKIEAFWSEPGIYSNRTNPVAGALSFFGLTSWLGRQDFLDLLHRYFGPLRLGELKQRVVIATFNWHGQTSRPDGSMPDQFTQYRDKWRPKIFRNFPSDRPDCDRPVVDVAYAAASPPGFRAVTNGYGDGGVFVPDPSPVAISAVADYFRSVRAKATSNYDDHVELFQLHRRYARQLSGKPKVEQLEWLAGDFALCLDRLLKKLLTSVTGSLGKSEQFLEATAALRHALDQGELDQNQDHIDQLYARIMVTCFELMELLAEQLLNMEGLREQDIEALKVVQVEAGFVTQQITDAKNGQPLEALAAFSVFHDALDQTLEEIVGDSGNTLARIALLSVGVCTRQTSYGRRAFNYSAYLFNHLIPTNVYQMFLYPPSIQIGLDAPSLGTVYQSAQLLGKRFHRMDPDLVGPPAQPPTLIAMSLARFPLWRRWLLSEIWRECGSSEANKAIEKAVKFIKSQEWL